MSITRPFVQRPIGTTLIGIGLFLLGAVCYRLLPVASLPQVDFPTIFVSASQSGADPETMASTVASPLERRLGQIPGINEITSRSSSGSATVIMQFDLSRDINSAARDVEAAINAAGADLPSGLNSQPTYRKANPNDMPVLILALTSKTLPLPDVYQWADERLVPRISQVDGVAEVDVAGGAQPAVRIQADPAKLASMGLSLDDLRQAVAKQSTLAPVGSLKADSRSLVLSINDQLTDPADYNNLVVSESNGTPVRLADVATVSYGQENDLQAGWFNNQRSVLLIVRKSADANVIQTVDQIKAMLPLLRELLPSGVDLQVQTDRTQTIRASVDEVELALGLSVALVIIVIFIFLRRLAPTLIAGVAVPLSLAATFVAMWLLGYSLNNLSLMALTVAVGFVVDDAIVVIENIVRHMEDGETPLQAALRGSHEIASTIISITLSLLAVFIPILFLGGINGRLFKEFSVSLAVAIAISGVISLTLTPSLCGRWLRAAPEHAPPGRLVRIFERAFERVHAGYRALLDWALHHPRVMLSTLLAAVALTLYLYVALPKGLFPQQDTGFLFGMARASESTSFDAMSGYMEQVRDIILSDPAVESMGASVGGGRGSTNSARMFISLKTGAEGRKVSGNEVVNRLRPKFAELKNVSVFLTPAQDLRVGGRESSSEYQFALRSSNPSELYEWAPRLANALRDLPELEDVDSDRQSNGLQMSVVVDRTAASRLGVSFSDINGALNNAFSQRQIATIYQGNDSYKIILEAIDAYSQDPITLRRIRIPTDTGTSVPLSAIAHFERTIAPTTVNHDAGMPTVTLSFNLAEGVSLSQATQLIRQTMLNLQMPGTIRGSFAGNAKLYQQNAVTLPLLILAALLAVYVVLGMLYESLIHPLTILSTLPSAGLGAVVALWLTNIELSLVAIIGIILLIGIVKKNAILMIDFALEGERKRGLTPFDAIREACLVRFRPILMTTLAALFGAVPLALAFGTGAELRQPLGVAVIGGLLLSQLLTLFTTPVVYLSLERLSTAGRGRRAQHKQLATS